MSSQHQDEGAPVFYNHDQVGLRLIELPPDLLELVVETASSEEKLWMRVLEEEDSTSSLSNTTGPNHVVLCTKDQTFGVRQIQSSNSLYVIQPCLSTSTVGDIEGGLALSGLEIFATCGSTIEIHKLEKGPLEKQRTVDVHLEEGLVPYFTPADATHSVGEGTQRGKQYFLQNLPFSDAEIEDAWLRLAAFEISGCGFVPVNKAIGDLWGNVITEATAEGMDLTGSMDRSRLEEVLETSQHPSEFISSVLDSIISTCCTGEESRRLDKAKLSQRTAQIALSICPVAQDGEGISLFMERWKTLLPGYWQDVVTPDASVRMISTISPRLSIAGSDTASSHGTGEKRKAAAEPPAPSKQKRNWHERLKKR